MARNEGTGATSYGSDHDGDVDTVGNQAQARDKFGGMNIGAGFFGWLVAMAIAILLTSIVGAIAAAAGASSNVTQSDAQRHDRGRGGDRAARRPAGRVLHRRVRRWPDVPLRRRQAGSGG